MANLAGYLNVPQRYANADPTEFRLKKAKADQAEAAADRYNKLSLEDERQRAVTERRGQILGDIAQMTDPATGKPLTPKQQLAATRSAALGAQDFEFFQATSKMEQELAKEEAAAKKAHAETMAKWQDIGESGAIMLAKNPTIETAELLANQWEQMGHPNIKPVREFIEQNRNATPEQIEQFARSKISPEKQKKHFQDLGGHVGEIDPISGGMTKHEKSITPGQQLASDDRAKQRVLYAGRTKSGEGDLQYKKDLLKFKKAELENKTKNIGKLTPAELKVEDKKTAKLRAGTDALLAIERMYKNAEDNPLAINSIFSLPMAGLHKILGSVMPETQGAAPLASFEADTALVATMGHDLLSSGSLRSKFAQERLETAMGAARSGNIQTTKDQLDIVAGIIAEETGLPLSPGVKGRLIAAGILDKSGEYIHKTKGASVPKMSIEELKAKHGIK